MTEIPPYPLHWPDHIERCSRRETGRFKTAFPTALNNVRKSLQLFGSDSGKKLEILALSSNVTLGVQKPADPGVAIWFRWGGMGTAEPLCIPVDRYTTVEANLQAIHHVIEARRVELRHGTLALLRASFRGFLALPAPSAARAWREVLDLIGESHPARDQIERHYLIKARSAHPDAGGSDEEMAALNVARDQALKEISSAST
jgi:hypothetical protein